MGLTRDLQGNCMGVGKKQWNHKFNEKNRTSKRKIKKTTKVFRKRWKKTSDLFCCSKLSLYFCNCICPYRCYLMQGNSRWVEHYILEGVTSLCFWPFRNLGTFELQAKTNAGVTPRGVVYTLRSVLRGLSILNAHFTGVYILQCGCFSVCFLQ